MHVSGVGSAHQKGLLRVSGGSREDGPRFGGNVGRVRVGDWSGVEILLNLLLLSYLLFLVVNRDILKKHRCCVVILKRGQRFYQR